MYINRIKGGILIMAGKLCPNCNELAFFKTTGDNRKCSKCGYEMIIPPIQEKGEGEKNEVVPTTTDNEISFTDMLTGPRKGIFEQGYDKRGRPYQKKLDDNGFYTKEERLKDGTPKLTIKKMKKKK